MLLTIAKGSIVPSSSNKESYCEYIYTAISHNRIENPLHHIKMVPSIIQNRLAALNAKYPNIKTSLSLSTLIDPLKRSQKRELKTPRPFVTDNQSPPRCSNSFILYRQEYENGLKENGIHITMAQCSKDAACAWKCATAEELAFWKELADIGQQYHKIEYPEYKFRPVKKKRKRAYRVSKIEKVEQDQKNKKPIYQVSEIENVEQGQENGDVGEIPNFCYSAYSVTLSFEAKNIMSNLITHGYSHLPQCWHVSLEFYIKLATFVTQWSWFLLQLPNPSMGIENYSHLIVKPIVELILYRLYGIEVQFGEGLITKTYERQKVQFLCWRISIRATDQKDMQILEEFLHRSRDSLNQEFASDLVHHVRNIAIHFEDLRMKVYLLDCGEASLVASLDLSSTERASLLALCEGLLTLNNLIVHNITILDKVNSNSFGNLM